MLRRLIRSTIVLGALLAAYQAYVLLGVPLMEPPLARKLPQEIPDFDGRQPVSQYQLLLANYFPQGHWSLARPPKVIATGNKQAMLVF